MELALALVSAEAVRERSCFVGGLRFAFEALRPPATVAAAAGGASWAIPSMLAICDIALTANLGRPIDDSEASDIV